jgi:hypothetical protein
MFYFITMRLGRLGRTSLRAEYQTRNYPVTILESCHPITSFGTPLFYICFYEGRSLAEINVAPVN